MALSFALVPLFTFDPHLIGLMTLFYFLLRDSLQLFSVFSMRVLDIGKVKCIQTFILV